MQAYIGCVMFSFSAWYYNLFSYIHKACLALRLTA
jgi:hypothetical protein